MREIEPPSKTAFLFSGQGSQHFQMGRALFEHVPAFRQWMLRLDGVVRDLADQSVVEALYGEHRDLAVPFDRIALSHPAIFMVEYALARALIAAGVEPDLTLGTSLGSFAAAAVAGFIDAERALAAVVQQAAAIETCCEPGAMVAVLADVAEFERAGLRAHGELAAVNFGQHFVVALPEEGLPALLDGLKSRQLSFQRLPVAFAFHSRWIDAAHAPFASYLASLRIGAGTLPLVCSERAALLDRLPGDFFWQVVRGPIRFAQAIDVLEREPDIAYIDVGPAGTLATFLRYLLPPARRSAIHSVMSAFGDDRTRFAALASGPHARGFTSRLGSVAELTPCPY